MKKYFVLIGLCCFISCAFAQKTVFVDSLYLYGYCPCRQTPFDNKIYRPAYGQYSTYYQNPYYNIYSYPRINITRYQHVPKQKNIRRLEKRRLNQLSFLKKDKGSLTGYSVPISQDDIYKQMGISPYDPKSKQKPNSINCSQELFSNPNGNETYYNNGKIIRNLGGATGKTGVTIIYD